jgi:dipeptidyl aminopeptidase/acylaminoacyl peptidase
MVRYSILLAGSAACLSPAIAQAACGDLLASPVAASLARPLDGAALAGMRDIGDPDVVVSARSPYAISPDGTALAFVISRGDPASNTICSALVVVPVDGQGPPRLLDRGGALPVAAGVYRDLYITTGAPEIVTPIWSPDGRWIAYRKVVDGVVQVVKARADGREVRQVSRGPVDVEALAWSEDGTAVVVQTRPDRAEANAGSTRRGQAGWHYDASVLPMQSWQPQPWAKDLPLRSFAIEGAAREPRPATREEVERVDQSPSPGMSYESVAWGKGGAKAWTERVSRRPLARQQVWMSGPDGTHQACTLVGCTGKILGIFWDASETSLVFLAREGWNNEVWVLYRWHLGARRLATVLRTTDALTGCISAGLQLVCGRENATTSRRIVAISLASGRSRVVFDPNPEFRNLQLGSVRRLRWTTDRGLPAWGDLVLPPDYDHKEKLPLVIVQYRSLGFLRGGIGNDYPIFPMAAKGLAVLSIERPPSVAQAIPGLTSWDDFTKAEFGGWAERRSMQSAIERGIDAAVATGVIDAARVGITGLSDGASSVEFALVNSTRFAAAAMSTCCDDLLSSLVLGGFAWGDQNRRLGFPASVDNDREFWKPLSLSLNARRINTPLLMQLADRETLIALPAIGALREAGKPVDVFVFPGEYHNKWQPAHRLAVYERSIDWFDFWLRGQTDPAPSKQAQYRDWEALRTSAGRTASATARAISPP